jgi:hypothetical protein
MSHSTQPRRTRALILFFAIVMMTSACAPALYSDATSSPRVPFTTIGMIPVIEGKINGKRAFFIVDTGASCSLLNEAAAHRYGFKYRARSEEQVIGLNGQAKINLAFDYQIQLGPVNLKQAVFRTRHLSELANIIRVNDHIDIAGIIGADILKRYGMVVDFNSNTVFFHPRNNTSGSGKELVAALP